MVTSVGTREELVERARSFVPTLDARQPEADGLRRVPDVSVAELREAGLHRLLQPARYGGAEAHFGGTVDVVGTLSTGCASTGWVFAQYISHDFLLSYWPPDGQDDVWGARPDATIAGSLIPSCGRAERTNGDWRLSGQWPFASGIYGADWFLASAFVETGDGAKEARIFAVPRAEIEILDTWHTVGLRATGSADVKLDGVSVPHHRTVRVDETKGGGTAPGCAVNTASLYRLGAYAMFSVYQSSVSYGLARGTVESYLEHMRQRVSRMTGSRVADYATAQSKVGEAAVCVDAAGLLLHDCCERAMHAAESGEVPSMALKTMLRGNGTYAGNLASRAVDLVVMLSGGAALYDSNPLSRVMRDMKACQAHITQTWDANGANYGRVLLGLPNTDPAL